MEEAAWDLQAVVSGGCTTNPATTATTTTTTMDEYSISCLFSTSLMNSQDDDEQKVSDIFSLTPCSLLCSETSTTTTALKELDENYFCKPFLFPNLFRPAAISSPNKLIPNKFSVTPFLGESSQQLQQQQQQQQKHELHPSLAAFTTTTGGTLPPKSKRRKIPQKKVVCKVPVEGLSSDMWAWRKYGQKPIKASPYPRGYYRCSSSKGCMAKKLVERSFSDPGMFVVTYKAEHNHPIPTHRNSLAGSTKNKVMMISATSTTPASNMEMEDNNKLLLQQTKQENREDNSDNLMRSRDDLFMGLEVLTGSTSTTTSNFASHMRF